MQGYRVGNLFMVISLIGFDPDRTQGWPGCLRRRPAGCARSGAPRSCLISEIQQSGLAFTVAGKAEAG